MHTPFKLFNNGNNKEFKISVKSSIIRIVFKGAHQLTIDNKLVTNDKLLT